MKFIKHGVAALALLAPTLLLTGCEDEAATAADAQEVDDQVRSKIVEEERELKTELAKLKAQDPSVVDMYYSADEEGNKQVNVVREVKDPKTGERSFAETMMPMMAGMMLGQMMANSMMMNSMMMANAANTRHYSSNDYRNRRNAATASYARSTRSSVSRSFVSSRPGSSYSARSSGALSSSSSARSSGYSAGG